MLSRRNLHDYQVRGVEFALSTPKCALWLDLGLGKTVTTLTTIADLVDSLSVHKVLVIAPLRVAKSVWKQEAANWSHLNHLRFSLVVGTKQQRERALTADADVYVTNRENVKNLVTKYKRNWPFDMVVIDESSSFKSSKSQRFKALRKVNDLVDRLIELTATPSSNGLIDVWAQIALLDNGQRLGRTMSAFKNRYFESDYMGYSWTLKKGCDVIIRQQIADLVLTMRAEDYLEMKEPVSVTVPVTLPAKCRDDYKTLEKEFIAEIDGEEVASISAAALANKLLQMCNGAVYREDKTFIELHDGKLDALAELVEQNDEPMLVAYNYKSDLARLRERFPDASVLGKDTDTIHRWNRGEIPMLLAHPASAGHGLNLQKGGSLIVWFGLNWSLELYQQFNGRLNRQGQTKVVRIVHLVAQGCIDEKVVKAIEAKAKTQNDLLNALKR